MKTDDRATQVVINKKDDNKNRPTTLANGHLRSTILVNNATTQGQDKEIDVNSLIGDEINGYEIDEVISFQSGQSVIYLGIKNKKKYVIKLYRDDATVIDPMVVDILQNKIKSDYVIPILDSGIYEGRFYTITPYYEEGAVIDHLNELDKDLLKNEYINQLNEGLNAIHNAGIYHNDIKPHNIYFTNDRKQLVIGDFGIAVASKKYDQGDHANYIAKRNFQENNATFAYLSPEGLEYDGRFVDYFALGMSLLNMSFGGDVYEDVDDRLIRDEIMIKPVRIPDNIDPEVAMLILKLLDKNHLNRATYLDVKKWCKDQSVYGKYIANSLCKIQIKRAIVAGNICNSTEEYCKALQENPEEALKQYKSGLFLNLFGEPDDTDETLLKELYAINKKYEEDPELGLEISILKVCPYAKFLVKGRLFNSFKDYLNAYTGYKWSDFGLFGSNYDSYNHIFNKDLFIAELTNEELTKKIKDATPIINTINRIDTLKGKDDYKISLLYDFYADSTDFYFNGTLKKNLAGMINDFYDNKTLRGLDHPEIFNDVVYDMLILKDKNMEKQKDKLKKIFEIENIFERNCQFDIFLTGNISFSLRNEIPLHNMYDIKEYAKKLYESKKFDFDFAKLFMDGRIYRFASQFSDITKDELARLEKYQILPKTSDSLHKIIEIFYNDTEENPAFVFEGVIYRDFKELLIKLSKAKDLQTLSTKLTKSKEFKVWLEKQGYVGVIPEIKEK